MKKIILILFIVHCTLEIGHSQSSWFCQNPIPCSGNLLNNFALDANTMYAIGGGGTIVKTSNGGVNWIYQSSNAVVDLFLSIQIPVGL